MPRHALTQESAAGRWRLALAAAALALLMTGCKEPDPIPPRTDVDCRAIKNGATCDQTPGCKFRWVDICVPGWRLDQAKWNPLKPGRLDPYGVQIDLIRRDRAELRAWATGRIGCYPKPPSKPKPKHADADERRAVTISHPSLFSRGIFCAGLPDVEPWNVPGYPWIALPLPCN